MKKQKIFLQQLCEKSEKIILQNYMKNKMQRKKQIKIKIKIIMKKKLMNLYLFQLHFLH